MKRRFWWTLIVISFLSFLMILTLYEKVQISLAPPPLQTSTSASPNNPSYTQSCSYSELTPEISQKLGFASGNYFISYAKMLDLRFIGLNLKPNPSRYYDGRLYVYDLGNDGILNTSDDSGFLIETTAYNIPFVFGSQNKTFYWISKVSFNTSEIKSCTISSQGCTNVQTINSFVEGGNIRVLGMAINSQEDRLYLATHNSSNTDYSFISCSIQPGNNDSCNNGFANYNVDLAVSDITFVKTLENVGFVYYDNNHLPILFNIISTPIQTTLPPYIDINTLTSNYLSLGSILIGIQDNFRNSSFSRSSNNRYQLAFVNSVVSGPPVILDTLTSAPNLIIQFFINDLSYNGPSIIYRIVSGESPIQKRTLGLSEIQLFGTGSPNSQSVIYPFLILPNGKTLSTEVGYQCGLSFCGFRIFESNC